MHFEITPALKHGRLTSKQRTSSTFSEAPTVAGKILRRGQKMKLSADQVELLKLKLSNLLKSESIVIFAVDESNPKIPVRVILKDLENLDVMVKFEPRESLNAPPVVEGGEGTDEVPDDDGMGAGDGESPALGAKGSETAPVTEKEPETVQETAGAEALEKDEPENQEKKGKKKGKGKS